MTRPIRPSLPICLTVCTKLLSNIALKWSHLSKCHLDLSFNLPKGEVHEFSGEEQRISGEVSRLVSTQENYPLIGTDKKMFLCVKVISSNPELTRQRKTFLSVPIHG